MQQRCAVSRPSKPGRRAPGDAQEGPVEGVLGGEAGRQQQHEAEAGVERATQPAPVLLRLRVGVAGGGMQPRWGAVHANARRPARSAVAGGGDACGRSMLSAMVAPMVAATTPSETVIGILYTSISSIFAPMNISTSASP